MDKRADVKKAGWNTIASILGALLAYPLSVGPANSLAEATGTSWFFVIYAPLDWAGENWAPVAAILEWYISLWVHP